MSLVCMEVHIRKGHAFVAGGQLNRLCLFRKGLSGPHSAGVIRVSDAMINYCRLRPNPVLI